MAWIESHQDLASNAKTRRAARILDVPVPQVVGHLHMLWWWALDHAFDGDITAFDALDLADAVAWDGDPDDLVKALVDCGPGDKVGFLEHTDDGRTLIHDWAEFTAHLRARREASKLGNHTRHHVNKGVSDPACDLCESPDAPYGLRTEDEGSPDGSRADSTGTDRNLPTEPEDTTSPPDGADPKILHDDPQLVQAITREFALAVKANGHKVPKANTANRNTWLRDVDLLLRLGAPGGDPDPPDPAEVRKVIAYATTDSFERANVQSPGKLRERYSQLRLKAVNGQRGSPPPGTEDDDFTAGWGGRIAVGGS